MTYHWVETFLQDFNGEAFWKDCSGVFRGCTLVYAKNAGFDSVKDIIGKKDSDMPWRDSAESICKSDTQIISALSPSMVKERGGSVYKIPLSGSLGVLGIHVNTSSCNDDVYLLENIVASMPGHVYWKDRDCVLLGCNDEQAIDSGLSSRHEVVGKTAYDLLWQDQPEEDKKKQAGITDEIDREIMESGNAKTMDEFVVNPNGDKQYFISRKVPLKNREGLVVGLVGISFDVTDKKVLEQELIESKKIAEKSSSVKSEFIANMSHDLRTPMTGVVGMLGELSYLREDVAKIFKDDEDALKKIEPFVKESSKNIEIAKKSANILLDMFNDILETISLDSGRVIEEAEDFRLSNVIEKEISLLRSTAIDKGIDLSASISTDMPDVFFGYRRILSRVILNLLSNALKFTEKGSVSLLASCEGKFVSDGKKKFNISISVEDTGIGVPEDKFEEIFQNFSRLTSSYKGKYKGSGLGLYSVKKYIETMDGEIRVSSKEGVGSAFTIVIPLEESHADIEKEVFSDEKVLNEEMDEEVDCNHDLEGKESFVLITEDNKAAYVVVSGMLKRLGIMADHAETGGEAVKMASKKDYKLILMDVGLPDISGIDATVAIRRQDHPTRRKVPIVALTGHVNKRDMCISSGMQDMITKPAEEADVKRVVGEYLSIEEDKEKGERSIFWDETVSLLGDEETARSIIEACSENIQENISTIKDACEARDVKTLRETMHHIKGGICYIKAPDLMEALEDFHAIVKKEPLDISEMKKSYDHLVAEMNRFVKEAEET